MTDFREMRGSGVGGFELRADGAGDGYTLVGYASVYETPYAVRDSLGEYHETIRSGAFVKSVAERDDVRLLLNHDGVPLARTKSGTLTLDANDPHGLRVEAHLDARSPLVAAVKSAMDRGDMDQMSFAFQATRQKWSSDYTQRDVVEAKLFDVSVVTYPASESTSASLRGVGADVAVEGRASEILSLAANQMRAVGSLDDVTRDLLLQIIGSLDAAAGTLECATETLEAVAGVAMEADASDVAEGCDCCADGCGCGDCVDCPPATATDPIGGLPVPQMNSANLMRLRAAALDL
jgi:HK97 family phage prohead protease